jgi:hypothetical protein
MLRNVHGWLARRKFPFAMLFGNPRVYSSSGYVVIENTLRYWDPEKKAWLEKQNESAMVKQLLDVEWPPGRIDLRGPLF